MTDFTTDAPMTRARHTAPKREYYAYFGLIFLATLPLAILTWALFAARRMELPEKGPSPRPGPRRASSRRISSTHEGAARHLSGNGHQDIRHSPPGWRIGAEDKLLS